MICSHEPWPAIAAAARPVPMIAMPMPASPQNSSCWTMGSDRPLASPANCCIDSKPYRPIFAASWMIGHGVSSRSSHSAAAGRTTPSAKPWTHSRMSFWSWFSSRVNFGSPWASEAVLASSSSAVASISATEELAMPASLHGTMSHHQTATGHAATSDVAQIEGAQPLAALVGAIEEAAVDAAIGLAAALVGALDRELAVRQGLAGHLDAAEAARLQHRRQVHLRPIDLLHAADVLRTGEAVDVAVEEAAAELDAATRLDHLVAEGAALAALADLGARCSHRQSLGQAGSVKTKQIEDAGSAVCSARKRARTPRCAGFHAASAVALRTSSRSERSRPDGLTR